MVAGGLSFLFLSFAAAAVAVDVVAAVMAVEMAVAVEMAAVAENAAN